MQNILTTHSLVGLLKKTFILLLCIAFSFHSNSDTTGLFAHAHSTSGGNHANSASDLLYSVMSLPDLIKATHIPPTYEFFNDAQLEEGRIVLTPKPQSSGAIWSKSKMQMPDSFTVEWVFRSLDFQGETEGGIAFWVVDSKLNDKAYITTDTVAGFKFNGLLLYLDSNGPSGSAQIRAIVNDNNEKQFTTMQELYANEIGSCLLDSYQDSSVPVTLRLTYDNKDDKNFIKLQIDNKVCFQTRQVALSKGFVINNNNNEKSSISVGVSAQNGLDAKTAESFEILKLNYYEGVIQESLIPNINQMPQPKFITKIVNQETGEVSYVEKQTNGFSNEEITLNNLYNKLNKIEGKVLANDVAVIYRLIEDLTAINKQQSKRIESLINFIESGAYGGSANAAGSSSSSSSSSSSAGSSDTINQYKDFIKFDEKLEKLLSEQEKLRALNKLEKESGLADHHFDNLLFKLLLWISPLVILMLVMAYYTFRIKQEIVKAKLL